MNIIIPYRPRYAFVAFHSTKKRFHVLCAHRRAGKTVSCVNESIKRAVKEKNQLVGFIEPTYKMAKRVVWDYVKFYARHIPGVKFNDSELKLELPNSSKILLLGSDAPDSLRGLGFDYVVFDEYSQQPPNIWGEIVRPAVMDKRGSVTWIGTIKGKNHLWKLYNTFKDDPEWFSMYLKASESGIIPRDELELARKDMTEDEYLQEMELEPTAFIKGAIYREELAQMRKEGRIGKVPYEKFLTVDTFWDLGVRDSMAIIFVQKYGIEYRIIDCMDGTGKGLDYYAKEIRNKPYLYDTHWLPHDARVRELGTGKSRMEILQEFLGNNGNIRITPNLPIHDGIQAGRLLLASTWIDEEKCEPFLTAIQEYQKEWDDKTGDFKKLPLHNWASHFADAWRYCAVASRSESGFTRSSGERIIGDSQYEPPIRTDNDLIAW